MKRLLALAALSAPAVGTAASVYVDQTIGSNCSNYSAASRSCGSGSAQAFSSLNGGLAGVGPGDILFLRAGSYGQLDIQQSGTASQPIVIQNYNGEAATVTGNVVGIYVIDKSNVTIRGISVADVVGFGRLENASRIIIDSVDFENASNSGTTGSLKIVSSSNNRIVNSSFDSGSDLMVIQDDANLNVIQGNSFGRAGHSLISIRCSSQNIIRANEFDNPDQKAMEIYDCEGVSDAPVRLDDAKRNLLEHNRFVGTASASRDHLYNAIQHGGQQTIVRHNVFADNLGGGSNYQYYSDESLYVYENRLYNNTFYNNRCHGIIGASNSSNNFRDNRVVNNLLYLNKDCSGGNQQTNIRNTNSVILTNNSVVNNDPGFTDAAARDLTLTSNSSQIDAGAFVASTVSNGSGTSMQVDDASWFYDGFGIVGEVPDMIQLEGQSEAVSIQSIDYASNTITLASPLTWSNGDGVHVKFAGTFEFGSTPTRRPNSPTDLTAN
jgi:hypothetical protein